MAQRDQILRILYGAIDEINSQQAADARLTKAEDTALYGSEARIDSLGLVNLVVEAEARLARELDLTIPLAETIMSGDTPPPNTVGALADFVLTLSSGDTRA